MNDRISIIVIDNIKYILTEYYLYKGREKKSLTGFGKGMIRKGKYLYIWTSIKVLRLNTLKWDRGFRVKGLYHDIRSLCKIKNVIIVVLRDRLVILKKNIIKCFKKGRIEDATCDGNNIYIQYIKKDRIKNVKMNSSLKIEK